MGDYAPVTDKRLNYTMLTSGAVTGGNLLVVTGSGTVAKASTAASISYVGVAAHDAPSGGRVTVWTRGCVHESIADGAIAAGAEVTTSGTANRDVAALAAAGAAYVQAEANASRAVIGIALTTGVDNAKFRWMSV
jgi:hypothetical protein